MGKVSNRILREAEEKKKEIIEATKKEAKEILDKAEEEAEKIKKRGEESAEFFKKRELERNLSQVRMALNTEKLKIKNEIIDDLMKLIEDRIKKLDWAKEYKVFIEKLILGLSEDKDEEVVVGRMHNDKVKSLIMSLDKKNFKFKISEEKGDFDVGLILRKKNKRINASLPILLEETMDDLKENIVKILFPSE